MSLSGSYTSPYTDTFTFLWQVNSSSNDQEVDDSTAQSLSFTPADNGVYNFAFVVADSTGASGSDTVLVTAENAAPAASIDSLTDETGAEIGVDVAVALAGFPVHLAASFTDAGISDAHTPEIDWGDGISGTTFEAFTDCTGGVTGSLSALHTYAAPGNYTITLEVTDDGTVTTTRQIEVVDASGAIEGAIESLTPFADDPNVQEAIDKLQGDQDGADSNGALDLLEQGNLNAALEKIKQALDYIEAAEAADPDLDLTYVKGLLALAAKSVAVAAIDDAEAVAVRENDLLKIQQARALVEEGDSLLAASNYVGAVGKYQQAVRAVQSIR